MYLEFLSNFTQTYIFMISIASYTLLLSNIQENHKFSPRSDKIQIPVAKWLGKIGKLNNSLNTRPTDMYRSSFDRVHHGAQYCAKRLLAKIHSWQKYMSRPNNKKTLVHHRAETDLHSFSFETSSVVVSTTYDKLMLHQSPTFFIDRCKSCACAQKQVIFTFSWIT